VTAAGTAAPGPLALGAVLAHLCGPDGRPVRGGALRGQLYASAEGLTLLRPPAAQRWFDRAALLCVAASVGLVTANLIFWRRMEPLWAALVLQGLYMLTLPARRRLLAPRPLDAASLSAATAAGRAALRLPAADLGDLQAPGLGQAGRRTPARLGLPAGGVLELWIGPPDFEALRAALGRA